MSNRSLVTTGAVLMVCSVAVPLLFFAISASTGGWEGLVLGLVLTFTVGPAAFLVGLILLIVGAARGRQQQQQQVVIVQGGAASSRFCTHCGSARAGASPFCPSCGKAAA